MTDTQNTDSQWLSALASRLCPEDQSRLRGIAADLDVFKEVSQKLHVTITQWLEQTLATPCCAHACAKATPAKLEAEVGAPWQRGEG